MNAAARGTAIALVLGAGLAACGPGPGSTERPLPASPTMEATAATTARHAAEAEGRWATIAARVDPHVDKPRVIVMTDIANEPDDQMSLVRYLVYANQFDTEGPVSYTHLTLPTIYSV